METTLPMVTFVLGTTGLSIITLVGLICSDLYQEQRARRALAKAPVATTTQTVARQQRRASAGQELLAALKAAA